MAEPPRRRRPCRGLQNPLTHQPLGVSPWKQLTRPLAALKVPQHPDKTLVGRVSRGFDFLDYTFATVGLTGLARRTVAPVCRTYQPALRARCGRNPHRRVRAMVVALGEWWGWTICR